MAVAMHRYQEDHGSLPPPAVYDKEGKPLLSWRVLLLPYMGDNDLHKEFRLDEPWDSPHNRRLLPKMPKVYAPFDGCPTPEPFTTFYQVFVGKGTAFEGPKGLHLGEDFPDGTSNTILIVEAGSAVPWTMPEELPYAADRPLPALGGMFRDTFRVAFADGSIINIRKTTSEATIRAAITRNGGEELGADW
jgi:hypothetical protein